MTRNRILPERPGARVLLALYALSFAGAWQLGTKLHIVSAYEGLAVDNYLLPWTGRDWLSLLALAAVVFLLACLALRLFGRRHGTLCTEPIRVERKGWFWGSWALLMVLWLPYLLRYYPAFFFEDTIQSMRQALNLAILNNRNPILYTLFMRLCMLVGGALSSKDVTAGCFVYALVQMLTLSGALAALCTWVGERGRLHWYGRTALALIFGLDPYVAAISIAMWKDPFFAAFVVLWTLELANLVLPEKPEKRSTAWGLRFFLLTLLVLFSRNNGFSAILGGAAGLLVLFLRRRRQRKERAALRPALLLTLVALLLWGIMIVPVYRQLGVGTPKEEMGGLMLNQMARVVVSEEGVLSEEEKSFLDEMLPLERYPAAYRPCCVDLLKWDDAFNFEALRGSRFMKMWFSILPQNIGIYAEGWVLETFGFWALNRPESVGSTANISVGSPLNFKYEGETKVRGRTLRFENKLPAFLDFLSLPTDTPSLPLGPLNWLLLLLALLLLLNGEGSLVLPLLPSLGIATGMLIGTPIYYLARYELPVQVLVPLFLLLTFRGWEKTPPEPTR